MTFFTGVQISKFWLFAHIIQINALNWTNFGTVIFLSPSNTPLRFLKIIQTQMELRSIIRLIYMSCLCGLWCLISEYVLPYYKVLQKAETVIYLFQGSFFIKMAIFQLFCKPFNLMLGLLFLSYGILILYSLDRSCIYIFEVLLQIYNKLYKICHMYCFLLHFANINHFPAHLQRYATYSQYCSLL